MGYILPITPYQSIQYANIQRASLSEPYGQIMAVEIVRKQTRSEKSRERTMDRIFEETEREQDVLPFPPMKPVLIKKPEEKTIAEITGKGYIVSTYA
ncbi:hypothetical protein D6T70_00765 [Kurthia gibsonii]|uniref:hypothetical protein n=1 Tax=Kurthia gibsonii TaxID=33946 RepID=UPI000EB49619|nr:hypothetical protein [Kurthia gibsonii]RXH53572.1 hypothetical protein D6T70_00765 [Kurthia gibsonii]